MKNAPCVLSTGRGTGGIHVCRDYPSGGGFSLALDSTGGDTFDDQFMWSCNDFMGPLLYVQTPAKYPMSLFVKLSMDGDTGFAWNRILALSLISILPQLIVFFCAQDQFVEGISAGAVKG